MGELRDKFLQDLNGAMWWERVRQWTPISPQSFNKRLYKIEASTSHSRIPVSGNDARGCQ